MAKEVRLRHRKRIKRKAVEPILTRLREAYGMSGLPGDEVALESAELDPERMPCFLLDNEVIALEIDGQVCPTVRGLLRWPATKRWVTVDMGAIRFVTNGADTMAPGITDADPEIQPGDPVWIRDETHGKPLAVGVAKEDGPSLKVGTKGKVVRAVHHLGDPLWHVGHEE